MKTIAIISPMILPVPDVNGGAVEHLITQIIEKNEKQGKVNIDIYTCPNEKIKNNYKYTNIIQIRKSLFRKILIRIINKLFGTNAFINIRYGNLKKTFLKKEYDDVIIENNMLLYLYLYSDRTNFYFHLHNDLTYKDKTLELYKRIATTCKKMIVISEFLKNKLLSQFYTDNVVILNNCIDLDKLINYPKLELKELDKFTKDSYIYGYVGRIDDDKGLLELLTSFNNYRNDNDKLLAICPDFVHKKNKCDYEKKLLFEYKKNIKNIFVTGYIDNKVIGNYYKYIDCLIIPTKVEEGFGMIALEGLAFRKKIISIHSGELPNILKNNGSIILARKDFIKKLGEMIKKESIKNIKFELDDNFFDKYSVEIYFKNFCDIIDCK